MLTKIVNGEEVVCSEEEEQLIREQWELEDSISIQNGILEYNNAIIAQLKEIDSKSIRALRTNDTERLNALEAQAASLRAQLRK